MPELVGQLRFKADKRSLGAFVRLRGDQALALENAPDRDSRWGLFETAAEVVEDGLGTGVEPGRRELGAELEDGVNDGLVDLMRTGGRAVGSGL